MPSPWWQATNMFRGSDLDTRLLNPECFVGCESVGDLSTAPPLSNIMDQKEQR